MTAARLYLVHAHSALHAGTGQGIGAIDLPIAREKATNLPYLPGSSIKGVLRDHCTQHDTLRTKVKAVFGPETDKASEQAGSLVVADARLLLLPVRSLAGTFAWVTSSFVLRRLARDSAGAVADAPPAIPVAPRMDDDHVDCLVATDDALIVADNVVYLEDIDLTPRADALVAEWARWLAGRLWPDEADAGWRSALADRLCIVPDDVMNFLAATATETIARVRMDADKKTVDEGALWYEEVLPAETVLAGLAVSAPPKVAAIEDEEVFAVLSELTAKTLQLGGKATVGRGLCRVQVTE